MAAQNDKFTSEQKAHWVGEDEKGLNISSASSNS